MSVYLLPNASVISKSLQSLNLKQSTVQTIARELQGAKRLQLGIEFPVLKIIQNSEEQELLNQIVQALINCSTTPSRL